MGAGLFPIGEGGFSRERRWSGLGHRTELQGTALLVVTNVVKEILVLNKNPHQAK